MKKRWWVRLLIALVAGLAFGIFIAVVLAVVDIYIAGHGGRPLSLPWLDVDRLGVHLSLADILFLGAVMLAAAITWSQTGRHNA